MSNQNTVNKKTLAVDPYRLTYEGLLFTLESGTDDQIYPFTSEIFHQLTKALKHIIPRLENFHENADHILPFNLELAKQKVLILLTYQSSSLESIFNNYYGGDSDLMGLPLKLASVLLYRLFRRYVVEEDGYAYIEKSETVNDLNFNLIRKYMDASFRSYSMGIVEEHSFDDTYYTTLGEDFSVKFRPRNITLEDQVAYNLVIEAVLTKEFGPHLVPMNFFRR